MEERQMQIFKSFLNQYNESCMYKIILYSNGVPHHDITYAVSRKMVEDIGLDLILQELKKIGYIDSFFMPKDVGGIEIVSSYYLIFPLIEKILDMAIKEPYLHYYTLTKERGEVCQEADGRYWIRDDSLYVNYVMKPENEVSIQSKAVILNRAISDLYNESIQNGEPAILKGWHQNNFVEPQEDGSWKVEFIYINKEMKYKVLEMYA